MRGKFITFEGCDGSGKSTQIRLLTEYLTQKGVDFIVTREPGGSKICEDIRGILLDAKNTTMLPESEALLYAAARVQHLHDTVLPALDGGKLVICDRYFHSSLAYQAYAAGLPVEFVENINSMAINDCPPDMTVFLDISSKEAFARKHGVDTNDRMEMLGSSFHDRVYRGYHAILKKYPNIYAVDCGGTKYETAEKIKNLLKEHGIIN